MLSVLTTTRMGMTPSLKEALCSSNFGSKLLHENGIAASETASMSDNNFFTASVMARLLRRVIDCQKIVSGDACGIPAFPHGRAAT
jgi:hypothetical protein